MKKLTHQTAEPILSFFDNELQGGKVKPELEDWFQDVLYFEWGTYTLAVKADFELIRGEVYVSDIIISEIIDMFFIDESESEYEVPEIFQIGLLGYLLDWFGDNIDKQDYTPKNYGYK